MNQRNTLLCAAAMGCLAVILGAFGAHAFKQLLTVTRRMDIYTLASQYQIYHALAMLLTGTLMNQFTSSLLRWAGVFFLVGILFFSGSLYALCFTSLGAIGYITPLGGLFFILGWISLFAGVYKKIKASS